MSTYGGSCDCGDLRFFPSNTCEAHSDDEPAFRQVESGMASLSVRSPSPTPSAVEPISKPKIFFSYSWNDADCVRPLAARCEAFADVWIDVKNLQGAHWLYHKIVQAIDDTDVMVVCISESYLKSDNCEKEILLVRSGKERERGEAWGRY